MEQRKNILVLTGSYRRGGDSSLMADAFIRGAERAGHTVTRFDTGRMKIGGCIACKKCFSKGTACVFNDDFNTIAPYIEEAETIVFITPLYWYTFTAQLKAAIDKIYSLFVAERPVKIKESILLVCGETDEISDFEGIIKTYESIYKLMKWENTGIITVPNVNEVGDILKTDALEKIEAMSAKL